MDNHPQAVPATGMQPHRPEFESVLVFHAASLPELLRAPLPEPLQRLLGSYLRTRRWFRGKARTIREIDVLDQLPIGTAPDEMTLMLIRVSYVREDPEVYVLALAFARAEDRAPAVETCLFALADAPSARARGIVYDPSGIPDLPHLLLNLFVREQTPGDRGRIRGTPSPALVSRVRSPRPRLEARVSSGEQSNTTVFFGQEFMLKLFRQLEAGENPDVELNEFLWAHGYRNVPEPLGSVRYDGPALVATLGIAQRFVPSDGSAWDATLEIVQGSLERARSMNPPTTDDLPLLLDDGRGEPGARSAAIVEPYAAFATLLGKRTAELHLALASDAGAPAFRPEPFTADFQRSIVRAARERVDRSCELLARQLAELPDDAKLLAEEVFACRGQLRASLDAIESMPVCTSRIRCHGDYHLGQLLYGTGDFTILDFEGEPAQPLEQRRQKGSALYDVCGMLRSFHYAGTVAWQSDRWRPEERSSVASWSEVWYRWASARFLSAYLKRAHASGASPVFLPESRNELRALLRLHLIDKCSYELSYELNNRPAWVGVPIAGLLGLAKAQ